MTATKRLMRAYLVEFTEPAPDAHPRLLIRAGTWAHEHPGIAVLSGFFDNDDAGAEWRYTIVVQSGSSIDDALLDAEMAAERHLRPVP